MSALMIELAGEQVALLPQKALLWPRERTLIVADIHFGKAASFRALGVPVPRGTTTQNLDALDELVEMYALGRIVFLGDFLHARAAHASATQAALQAWRQRRPRLDLVLVRGNHDRRAGDPATRLSIELVDEPWMAGPFAFCHHPDLPSKGYVLAGHVHPAFLLASRFDSLRLPCFVVGPRRMILPSFGAFTGGHLVTPCLGDGIYVSSGDAVHCVRQRTDAVSTQE